MVIAVEHWTAPDGTTYTESHGPSCARTQQIVDAVERGERLPPPGTPTAARCGPAMVNSDAFRDGWEGIFGKKLVVGEA